MQSLMRLVFTMALVATAFALCGCEGVVVGGFGEGTWWHRAPPPVRAAHPLGGSPLSGSAKPRDPDLVRARAAHCRPFPIEDRVAVEVRRDKVCVRQEVHVLSYESGSLPMPSLPSEVTSSNGGTRKVSLVPQSELSKVGVCVGLDAQRTAVWVRAYGGCIPNDGLVDGATQSLALSKPGGPLTPGYETIRWTFEPRGEPARPPAPSSTASPSAVSPLNKDFEGLDRRRTTAARRRK